MRKFWSSPRLLVGLVFVGLLVAVAIWPHPLSVDMASASRGRLEVTLDEEGRTRVRERFTISAPVAGRVLRIEIEPGDPVQRGETILATFRPEDPAPLDARAREEAQAAAAGARAAIGRAEAGRDGAALALTLARAEAERARTLAASGVVSRELIETRETAERTAEESLRAADWAISVARHEHERARARLSVAAGGSSEGTTTLRSPIDGVVLQRFRESEAVVSAGEPLVEVADPQQIEIVVDLLSTDAVRVRAGQRVLVDRWGGSEVLEARVRRVEPHAFTKISALGVEEQRANVVIDLERPVELGDGYRVEVRVVVASLENAVKIPTAALFRRGESWATFAVESGRARRIEVEIGEHNENEAEVRSGLGEGQVVIVHPSDAVRDGVRVTAREG